MDVVFKGNKPQYSSERGAGAFLTAERDTVIDKNETSLICTGTYIKANEGTAMLLMPVSGLTQKFGITLANGVGVFDCDHEGEIKAAFSNGSSSEILITKGERIAQLLFIPVIQAQFQLGEVVDTKVEAEGFGSSDGMLFTEILERKLAKEAAAKAEKIEDERRVDYETLLAHCAALFDVNDSDVIFADDVGITPATEFVRRIDDVKGGVPIFSEAGQQGSVVAISNGRRYATHTLVSDYQSLQQEGLGEGGESPPPPGGYPPGEGPSEILLPIRSRFDISDLFSEGFEVLVAIPNAGVISLQKGSLLPNTFSMVAKVPHNNVRATAKIMAKLQKLYSVNNLDSCFRDNYCKIKEFVRFDTSTVTSMASTFSYRPLPIPYDYEWETPWIDSESTFNLPINFDMSSVVDASYFLKKNVNFNRSINFNTASLVNAQGMFSDCSSLNKPLNLFTGQVVDFSQFLRRCTSYNLPLTLDTSSAVDLSFMLGGCVSFNSEVQIDCQQVRTMEGFLSGCEAYNTPIILKTPRVENFGNFLRYCTKFNSSVDIDTTSARSLTAFFRGCTNFNQPITLAPEAVEDWSYFLFGCKEFNQPIDLNTVSALDMSSMFRDAEKMNSSLNLNTLLVTSMKHMFRDTVAFNQELNFITPNLRSVEYMFYRASGYRQSLSDWYLPLIPSEQNRFDYQSPLGNSSSLRPQYGRTQPEPEVGGGDLGSGDSATPLPPLPGGVPETRESLMDKINSGQDVTEVNTSQITDFSNLIVSDLAKATFNQEILWDARSATTFWQMFSGARAFNSRVSLITTPSLTRMNGMFNNCTMFNSDVGISDTSKVTHISMMFHACDAFNKPLSFDMSSVTSASKVFYSCDVFDQDLSSWRIPLVPTAVANFSQFSNLYNSRGDSVRPTWG